MLELLENVVSVESPECDICAGNEEGCPKPVGGCGLCQEYRTCCDHSCAHT